MRSLLIALLVALPLHADCTTPWFPRAGSVLHYRFEWMIGKPKPAMKLKNVVAIDDEVVGIEGKTFVIRRTNESKEEPLNSVVTFHCVDEGLRPADEGEDDDWMMYEGVRLPRHLEQGKRWTLTIVNPKRGSGCIEYRVTGRETIEVGLAKTKMPAWRIDFDVSSDLHNGGTLEHSGSIWLVEGIGLVRQVEVAQGPYGPVRETLDLVSVDSATSPSLP